MNLSDAKSKAEELVKKINAVTKYRDSEAKLSRIREETATVAELIDRLKQFDDDTPVVMGCASECGVIWDVETIVSTYDGPLGEVVFIHGVWRRQKSHDLDSLILWTESEIEKIEKELGCGEQTTE